MVLLYGYWRRKKMISTIALWILGYLVVSTVLTLFIAKFIAVGNGEDTPIPYPETENETNEEKVS